MQSLLDALHESSSSSTPLQHARAYLQCIRSGVKKRKEGGGDADDEEPQLRRRRLAMSLSNLGVEIVAQILNSMNIKNWDEYQRFKNVDTRTAAMFTDIISKIKADSEKVIKPVHGTDEAMILFEAYGDHKDSQTGWRTNVLDGDKAEAAHRLADFFYGGQLSEGLFDFQFNIGDYIHFFTENMKISRERDLLDAKEGLKVFGTAVRSTVAAERAVNVRRDEAAGVALRELNVANPFRKIYFDEQEETKFSFTIEYLASDDELKQWERFIVRSYKKKLSSAHVLQIDMRIKMDMLMSWKSFGEKDFQFLHEQLLKFDGNEEYKKLNGVVESDDE